MSALSEKTFSFQVSATIGSVSGKIVDPGNARSVLTLAHGAGAGMNHPFMQTLAEELAKVSVATLRYNFPYMENKKGRPDPPAIAEKTVDAAITKAHELYPKLPVFAAGKSFGGRMTSQRLSKESPPYVKGIIFYGFPLHPAGAPSIERAGHLSNVKVPMLFLQGTKDTLAQLDLLEGILKGLPMATLNRFEGADHSFKVSKKQIIDELAKASGQWITKFVN